MPTTERKNDADRFEVIERLVDIIGDDRNIVRGKTVHGDCAIRRKKIGHGFIVTVDQPKSPERKNATSTTFNIGIDGESSGSTRVWPEFVSGRGGAGFTEDAHFDLGEVLESFQEGHASQALRLIKQKLGDGKRVKGKTEGTKCEIVKESVLKFGGYKVTIREEGGGPKGSVYRIYGDGSAEQDCEVLVSILKKMEVTESEEADVDSTFPTIGIGERIRKVLGRKNS